MLFSGASAASERACLTGAFLADRPGRSDIQKFKEDYGKKPALVMVFLDWNALPDRESLRDIYAEGSRLFLTWEPWTTADKKGIDYGRVLAGADDAYLAAFAARVKSAPGEVYIRFAHEANGDWYPWSGPAVGRDRYIALYRHVVDFFRARGVDNARWVFSVNWEDAPGKNHFSLYYPGARYVDLVGIDGYNWGKNRWVSFERIFARRYRDVVLRYGKPVMISEFGSASGAPGMKARWIREAMKTICRMKEIKAFVLFNVDKEADWRFPPGEDSGQALKEALASDCFSDHAPVSG